MVQRVRDNFLKGIRRIRWFASVLAERTRVEVAVIKLLFRSDDMQQKKALLMQEIGQRVYACRGQHDRNILRDRVVTEALSEIERIENEIAEIKTKVSEIGGTKA